MLLPLNFADFVCRHQNRSETSGETKGNYVPVLINNSEMVGFCEDREHCGGRSSCAQRPLNTRTRKNIFWALSQNCEKRTLASSCLSVCSLYVHLQAKTRLQLEGFSWNLVFEGF